MDEKQRQAWAEFRFAVIAPLVSRRLDDAERRQLKRDILSHEFLTPDGERRLVADRTLRTWLNRYQLYGFDGLLRMESRNAGVCAAIPEELLTTAVALRGELRTRSIKTILSLLRAKGFDVSTISPSTLNFHLNRLGATKEKLASEKGTFQLFQKEHANDLWQADCSGGIYLPDPYNKGQHKQTRLISMIDDATRVIAHAAFYWDEQLPSLFDCFRQALLKRGKTRMLYTDNGPCFRAGDLSKACARLGIELVHAARYTPEGKGKIERHIGTVKSGFYQEAKHSGVLTIEQLNEFFFAWLELEYHQGKHKSLGMSPSERWQQDEAKGLITLVTPESIRQALMLEADRRVNKKTAAIHLNNRMYQASRELAGKDVQVRWEADRRSSHLEVWLNGKLVESASEIVPGSNIDYSKRPNRDRGPSRVPTVLQSSKLYRQSLTSNFRSEVSPPLQHPDYICEEEFQQLVASVLRRKLSQTESSYLSRVFDDLSPLQNLSTVATLQKAVNAKGRKMHLRYYCDLLALARVSQRTKP